MDEVGPVVVEDGPDTVTRGLTRVPDRSERRETG